MTSTTDREEAGAERGTDRIASFSDGVCAIAITLVVLPLIDTAREFAGKSAASFFTDNVPALLAAAISFITISLFWRDHHRLFNHVSSWSATIVSVNLVWLAGISFIPLATVIEVGADSHDSLARAVYVGAILATMIVARVEELLLVGTGRMDPRFNPPWRGLTSRWVAVGLMALALIISVSVPATGLWSMLLALLTRPLAALVRRGAGRR